MEFRSHDRVLQRFFPRFGSDTFAGKFSRRILHRSCPQLHFPRHKHKYSRPSRYPGPKTERRLYSCHLSLKFLGFFLPVVEHLIQNKTRLARHQKDLFEQKLKYVSTVSTYVGQADHTSDAQSVEQLVQQLHQAESGATKHRLARNRVRLDVDQHPETSRPYPLSCGYS